MASVLAAEQTVINEIYALRTLEALFDSRILPDFPDWYIWYIFCNSSKQILPSCVNQKIIFK